MFDPWLVQLGPFVVGLLAVGIVGVVMVLVGSEVLVAAWGGRARGRRRGRHALRWRPVQWRVMRPVRRRVVRLLAPLRGR